MVKTHRAIHQWDNWLTQPSGHHLLETERCCLKKLLVNCFGKHELLIGVPQQQPLLNNSSLPIQILISPLINKNRSVHLIEGNFYKLPIATGSIDLVLLPHSLEFMDNPQALLAESCRIVKPEGHIVIFGFNPYSLWGLAKNLLKNNEMPWTNNFIPANKVIKWLGLADFELIKRKTLLYRPPLLNENIYRKLKILEFLGNKLWTPFGGVYMLMAKAKVIPLTPIKLHWQQQLSGIPISSIPGSSVRNIPLISKRYI